MPITATHSRPACRHAPDYSRQVALARGGPRARRACAAASVLVVGAGGLGVPVLQYLAGAGVGRLGIVDGDRLEPSNLHRQTWYALAECGRDKAALAAARVQRAESRSSRRRARAAARCRQCRAARRRTTTSSSTARDNFGTQVPAQRCGPAHRQAGVVRQRLPVRRAVAAGRRRRRLALPALRVAGSDARWTRRQLRRGRRAGPGARRVRQPAGARGAEAVAGPAGPGNERDADLRSHHAEHPAAARAARGRLRGASARRQPALATDGRRRPPLERSSARWRTPSPPATRSSTCAT